MTLNVLYVGFCRMAWRLAFMANVPRSKYIAEFARALRAASPGFTLVLRRIKLEICLSKVRTFKRWSPFINTVVRSI